VKTDILLKTSKGKIKKVFFSTKPKANYIYCKRKKEINIFYLLTNLRNKNGGFLGY